MLSVCGFPSAWHSAWQLGDAQQTWAEWVGWRSSGRTAAYQATSEHFSRAHLTSPEAVLWAHRQSFLPRGSGPLRSREGWSFIACRVRWGLLRRRVFQLVGEEGGVSLRQRSQRKRLRTKFSPWFSDFAGLGRGMVEVQWWYSCFRGRAQRLSEQVWLDIRSLHVQKPCHWLRLLHFPRK